jgi:hypothetical protein
MWYPEQAVGRSTASCDCAARSKTRLEGTRAVAALVVIGIALPSSGAWRATLCVRWLT